MDEATTKRVIDDHFKYNRGDNFALRRAEFAAITIINKLPQYQYLPDQIFVFGSIAHGKKNDIGDIDLGVTTDYTLADEFAKLVARHESHVYNDKRRFGRTRLALELLGFSETESDELRSMMEFGQPGCVSRGQSKPYITPLHEIYRRRTLLDLFIFPPDWATNVRLGRLFDPDEGTFLAHIHNDAKYFDPTTGHFIGLEEAKE